MTELDDEIIVHSLEELCRRRVLRDLGDGIYDFTHARIRDVVAARLSTARRRFLHKRSANALLDFYGSRNESVAARLAEHYEAAGYPLQAAMQYGFAARYAVSVYANDEGLAFYRKGLAAVAASEAPKAGADRTLDGSNPHTAAAVEGIDVTALHSSLWEGQGDVQFHVGRHNEAQRSFAQALALLPREAGLARARLLRKKGNTARASQRYDEAKSWYNASEATLGPLSPDFARTDGEALAAWVDIQLDRLNLLYGAGRIADMEAISQRMGPVIDRSADWEHRTRYHHALATMLHRKDRFVTSDAALTHGEAQLEAARATNDPRLEAEAHFALGFLQLWRGATDAADHHLLAALTWAETTGDLLLRVRASIYLGFLRRRQNDVQGVFELSSTVLELSRRAGLNEYIAAGLAHHAWVAWRRGDLGRARSDAQEALKLWDEGKLVYPFMWAAVWPLLAVELGEGRDAAAMAAITSAERLVSPEQQRLPATIEVKLNKSLAAWRQSEADDMKAFLREALKAAEEGGYS